MFGSSKEPTHRDGSLEYPQHMFWLRNKNNNFQLHTLIWRPVTDHTPTHCFMRKRHRTLTDAWQQEHNFPLLQPDEGHQAPHDKPRNNTKSPQTMGATINNESTTSRATASELGDNCIQNFHFFRYIVGSVGNLVLQRRESRAIKCNFRTYIRQYTSKNENF